MAGAQTHEDLVVWQLTRQLKLEIHELAREGPLSRDLELRDQLERAARNAPRAIAEGFGRYLPGDFTRYLRYANGELKEIQDGLQDAVDRGYLSHDRVLPLQRLAKRALKGIGSLIAYLRSSNPPNEPRRSRSRTP